MSELKRLIKGLKQENQQRRQMCKWRQEEIKELKQQLAERDERIEQLEKSAKHHLEACQLGAQKNQQLRELLRECLPFMELIGDSATGNTDRVSFACEVTKIYAFLSQKKIEKVKELEEKIRKAVGDE